MHAKVNRKRSFHNSDSVSDIEPDTLLNGACWATRDVASCPAEQRVTSHPVQLSNAWRHILSNWATRDVTLIYIKHKILLLRTCWTVCDVIKYFNNDISIYSCRFSSFYCSRYKCDITSDSHMTLRHVWRHSNLYLTSMFSNDISVHTCQVSFSSFSTYSTHESLFAVLFTDCFVLAYFHCRARIRNRPQTDSCTMQILWERDPNLNLSQ